MQLQKGYARTHWSAVFFSVNGIAMTPLDRAASHKSTFHNLSYLGTPVVLQRCKRCVCGENVDNTACAKLCKQPEETEAMTMQSVMHFLEAS